MSPLEAVRGNPPGEVILEIAEVFVSVFGCLLGECAHRELRGLDDRSAVNSILQWTVAEHMAEIGWIRRDSIPEFRFKVQSQFQFF